MRGLIRRTPAVLAFSLLAFQAILPWTAPYFMTMDGPSHLYNARVVGEVLFNPSSPYRPFYQLRSAISTNWGTVILFNLVSRITISHAEAVVATLSVVAAFLSFSYLLRGLDRGAPWSPVINFLTFTWFLWAGFYNFYLAIALFALAVGYYVRRGAELTFKQAGVLSLLLVATFFTHVLPAVLAILCILILAIWFHGFRSVKIPVLVSVLPACILIASFVLSSHEGMRLTPEITTLHFSDFSSPVFASSYGITASTLFLYPAILCYMVAGILLLTREEWRSARGALAIAAILCFILYLLLPSHGFGGEQINVRVAWAVFVLGCTAAASGSRMQRIAPLIAIYVAAFLGANIYRAMKINIGGVSNAVAEYEKVVKDIPAGARVVRIRYPMDGVAHRYGYDGLSLDPIFHADSWLAARGGFVTLSDYQALSKVFALECRPPVTEDQRANLWSLEGGNEARLQSLLVDFPAPIDYVLVMGNQGAEHIGPAMELVTGSATETFVRLYRRKQ